jgi:hypothetical protein
VQKLRGETTISPQTVKIPEQELLGWQTRVNGVLDTAPGIHELKIKTYQVRGPRHVPRLFTAHGKHDRRGSGTTRTR